MTIFIKCALVFISSAVRGEKSLCDIKLNCEICLLVLRRKVRGDGLKQAQKCIKQHMTLMHQSMIAFFSIMHKMFLHTLKYSTIYQTVKYWCAGEDWQHSLQRIWKTAICYKAAHRRILFAEAIFK